MQGKSYSKETITKALEAWIACNYSISEASLQTGISYNCIATWISKYYLKPKKINR